MPICFTSDLSSRRVFSRRLVHDGLKEGYKEEYYAVENQRFLGAEGFGKRMAKQTQIAADAVTINCEIKSTAL